jgi:hypothetical protein
VTIKFHIQVETQGAVAVGSSAVLGVNISIKHTESHPKKLLLQAQHLIFTGVPIPGNVRAAVVTDRGTRFRFSTAIISSLVSVLPHFGQRALKNRIFGGRLRFMSRCDDA